MAKLKLKKPLVLSENTTITELNFREHTIAADYLSFDKKGGVAQRIALIASMTGNDEALILRLSGKDYQRAEKLADQILALDDEPDEEVDAEKK